MSKHTVFTTITALPPQITRDMAVAFLQDYEEMIDLNPLVAERHPIRPPIDADIDEADCIWYSLTDRISYLPGGLATGDVSYTCVFRQLPSGISTHCRAPMGVDIRERWTIGGSLPGEPRESYERGLDIPVTGLYIREDADLRCNVLMAGFVKKTLKKSHATLVAKLADKAMMLARDGRIDARYQRPVSQLPPPQAPPQAPPHYRSVSQPPPVSPMEQEDPRKAGLGIVNIPQWQQPARVPEAFPPRRPSPPRVEPRPSPPQPQYRPQLVSNGDHYTPFPDPLRVPRKAAVPVGGTYVPAMQATTDTSSWERRYAGPSRGRFPGETSPDTSSISSIPSVASTAPSSIASVPPSIPAILRPSWDRRSAAPVSGTTTLPKLPQLSPPLPQAAQPQRASWGGRYTKPSPPKLSIYTGRASWDSPRPVQIYPPPAAAPADTPRVRATSLTELETAVTRYETPRPAPPARPAHVDHPDYPSMNPYDDDDGYSSAVTPSPVPEPLRVIKQRDAWPTPAPAQSDEKTPMPQQQPAEPRRKEFPVFTELAGEQFRRSVVVAHPVALQPGMMRAPVVAAPLRAEWMFR